MTLCNDTEYYGFMGVTNDAGGTTYWLKSYENGNIDNWSPPPPQFSKITERGVDPFPQYRENVLSRY